MIIIIIIASSSSSSSVQNTANITRWIVDDAMIAGLEQCLHGTRWIKLQARLLSADERGKLAIT